MLRNLVEERRGYSISFALGLGGALGALWIGLPLPWFLGPMIANAAAAIAGVHLKGPDFLRPIALPILGVMLGSAFYPEIIGRIGTWAISFALLPAYVIFTSVVCYSYFRKVAGKDHVTSYFASMPGGLTDMVLLGEAYGGDVRQIALAHSVRILVVVTAVALFFGFLFDVSGQSGARPTTHMTDLGFVEAIVLVLCAVVGPAFARRLRIPAHLMLGPLILSAVAHLTSVSELGPPTVLSLAAQFVLGAGVGARFSGITLSEAAGSMMHGVVAAVLGLLCSALAAFAVVTIAGVDFFEGFLGYAPGGMMEMSMLALAINQSVAFVSLCHTLRFAIVMFAAPVVFQFLRTKTG